MNYTKNQIERIKSELTPIDTEELFDEMADSCFEEVEILGYKMSQASILKQCDPIAYRQEVLNYADSCINDTITDEIDGEHYNLSEVEELMETYEEELMQQAGQGNLSAANELESINES